MGEVVGLLKHGGGDPNWAATTQVITEVDGDMVAKLRSESWTAVSVTGDYPGGQGEFLVADTVQQVLRDDRDAARHAMEHPPDGVSLMSFVDGIQVYLFDDNLDDELADALERLRDFGVLQSAGLTIGFW